MYSILGSVCLDSEESIKEKIGSDLYGDAVIELERGLPLLNAVPCSIKLS